MGIVVKNIKRTSADLIQKISGFDVATIHEAQGRSGLLHSRLRPVYAGAYAAGSAVTVLVPPGDNWMLHVAVELCGPGDVMVVAPTSPCGDGYFGELLATSFSSKGVAGLIIDAGCRDTRALKEMQFPVWSRTVSACGTVKETPGDVNIPIVCAEKLIRPGDVIVADDDGVVVIEQERVEEVIKASEERIQRESEVRARLAAGELGLDIYEMRKRLKEKGLKYI